MTPPDEDLAGTELERVARRWQQLPLDHALAASPALLALAQRLADAAAAASGTSLAPVPDLGPAVVVDQLRVLLHDARRDGVDRGWLAEQLGSARRDLP